MRKKARLGHPPAAGDEQQNPLNCMHAFDALPWFISTQAFPHVINQRLLKNPAMPWLGKKSTGLKMCLWDRSVVRPSEMRMVCKSFFYAKVRQLSRVSSSKIGAYPCLKHVNQPSVSEESVAIC